MEQMDQVGQGRRIPRGQPDDYPRRITTGHRASKRAVTWEIAPGHVLVTLQPDADARFISRFAESLGAKPIAPPAGIAPATVDPLARAGQHWLFIPELADSFADTSELFARLEELRQQFSDQIRTMTPVFRVEGTDVALTAAVPLHQRLIVELHAEEQAEVRRRADERGMQVRDITLGPTERDVPQRLAGRLGVKDVDDLRKRLPIVLQVTNPDPRLSGFDLVGELDAIDGVAGVDLDWRTLHGWLEGYGAAAAQPPGWNLTAINAPNAWLTTEGDPGVVVALLDSCFDLDHSDLSTGYSAPEEYFNAEAWALTGGAARGLYDVSSALIQDGHGTATTGIVGASHTSGTEVRGVAPACTVLPVALGLIPTSVEVGGGLLWAIAHGARVANMSFETVGLDYTSRALSLAWEAGMVLCAAAGNRGEASFSPPLPFPAWHPEVMAVGATMDADGRRKVPLAPGEWGSQYGDELSVIAPGVSCETTDVTGAGGFDPMADFITDAQATSIATPHVAGLAALLLSANPERTNDQVRRAIERSCRFFPGYLPNAEQRGTPLRYWHREVGFGLIDCAAALREAALIDLEDAVPDPGGNARGDATANQLTAEDLEASEQFVATVHGSDARCLHGYLFEGVRGDNKKFKVPPTGGKLYLTSDLDEWLEIPEGSIVRVHAYSVPEAPNKLVAVWVGAGAQVQHVRRQAVADFLSGSLVDSSGGLAGLDLLAELLAQASDSAATSGFSSVRGPCRAFSSVRGPCRSYSSVRGPCH